MSLLKLDGIEKIDAKVSIPAQTTTAEVIEAYRPLVAQISMERMTDALIKGEPEGHSLLKIMAPYMFKRQAQEIEIENKSGFMNNSVADALKALIGRDFDEEEDD